MTLISLLGGLSAILILTNFPRTVGLDFENAEFNLQQDNSTHEIEDFDFNLPFNFTNSGYFNLENLRFSMSIDMNYSHVDYPSPGVNTTRTVLFFSNSQNFGDIPKGETGIYSLTGDMSNLNMGGFPNFTTEVDWYRGPPAIEYSANMTISLDYSVRLISVTIGVQNLQFGGDSS